MTNEHAPPRRFKLVRHEDNTGVSGEGIVAHGVEFGDGAVVMQWHNEDNEQLADIPNGMAVKPAPNGVEATREVHGHEGRTELRWMDDSESAGRRPDKFLEVSSIDEDELREVQEQLVDVLSKDEGDQSVEEAVDESGFEASTVSAPVGGVSPLDIPTSPGARLTNCEVLSDPWLAFILGMASMGLVWAGSLII